MSPETIPLRNRPSFRGARPRPTSRDAVDAADPGDTVWVTNGLYDGGCGVVNGDSTTRVTAAKALTLRSVNGPAATTLSGDTGQTHIRCVYLTNGATLIGFTLQDGGAQILSGPTMQKLGGGADGEPEAVVSNCVIRDCYAYNQGGGAYSGTFHRCSFSNNSATWYGGGSRSARLVDCRLDDNRAREGGGADQGALSNCWLSNNFAATNGGGTENSRNLSGTIAVDHSCSTPLAAGEGNIADSPLFVDPAGGDYRLQPGSPCIDGASPEATGAPDRDGIAVADMGSHEFVHPAADSDGDRIRDADEFYCDTDPTDPTSSFHVTDPPFRTDLGVEIRWNGTARRTYRVERSTNLLDSGFEVVASHLEGTAAGSFRDEGPPPDSPTLFYRILAE